MEPTLVVVQCRCESRRLPAKALYPVAGIPLLAFLLRRLRSQLDDKRFRILLATTRRPVDNVVAAWGDHEGVAVLRGEENDVLARFTRCLKRFPSPLVVRVTADNPLTCPQMLRRAVCEARRSGADYVQCRNLPHGTAVDVFGAPALDRLNNDVRQPDEREHINLNILRHPRSFKIIVLDVHDERSRPDLRMTVDTLEDWLHVVAMMNGCGPEPWRMTLREAIKRMDRIAVCRATAA